MRKTLVIWLLALCVLLCAPAALAQQETSVIRTADDLLAMEWNGSYVLGNDIDMSGVSWTPMDWFGGSLDGQGHTIHNLTITSVNGYHLGLFGQLDGSVSNLRLQNFYVDVSAPGSGCGVAPFGYPTNSNGFDPATSEARIINCYVSGEAYVSAGSSYVHMFGLEAAQDSGADMNLYLDADQFDVSGLRNCRGCWFAGNIHVQDQGSNWSFVSMIDNSLDCEAYGEMVVECSDPQNGNAQTYGVRGSKNCSVAADLSSQGQLFVINACDNCEAHGEIESDWMNVIIQSTHSWAGGTYRNLGDRSEMVFTIILDNEEEETKGNFFEATCEFTEAEATTLFNSYSMLSPSSLIDSWVTISAGSADVEFYVDQYGGTMEEYATTRGNISVETTSGSISMNLRSSNFSDISAVSDTGDITLKAGHYNSGDITVEGNTGKLIIYGAEWYNCGDVQVTSNGNVTVGGACSNTEDPAINEGRVTITGEGTDVSIVGAYNAAGGMAYNASTVSAKGKGPGVAIGARGTGPINEGGVSMESTGGDVNVIAAYGSDGYNTGNVYGSTTGSKCVASVDGLYQDGGTGYSNATCTAYSASGEAYADADAGYAVANGTHVHTWGARHSAYSSVIGRTLTRAYAIACRCPGCGAITVDYSESSYTSTFQLHYSECNASLKIWAVAEDDVNGTSPDPEIPEGVQPEEGEGEETGEVIMNLYGSSVPQSSYEIHSFGWAMGSLSFPCEDENDYTRCTLRVIVKNNGEERKSWDMKLELPPGFSLQPWSLSYTMPLEVSVGPKSSKKYEIPIYPLYLHTRPAAVTFSVTGDLEKAHSVAVNEKSISGFVYAAPTAGVNYTSVAIQLKVDLDPVADLLNSDVNHYNQNLAVVTCALSQAIYQPQFLYQSLEGLGFTKVMMFDSYGFDDVASCFALKKMVRNGQVVPVVMATVRGTVGEEWIGNFIVGNSTIHQGFQVAASNTLDKYKHYLEINQLPNNCRTIFGSHSRASAVTNLMVHSLNSSSASGERVAYCYATPNTTKNPIVYDNIYNITYVDDVVGYTPQGYYKYGKTFMIGSLDYNAPGGVQNRYFELAGNFYPNPRNTLMINGLLSFPSEKQNELSNALPKSLAWLQQKNGGKNNASAQAHCGELYLAWILENALSGSTTYDAVLQERMARIEADWLKIDMGNWHSFPTRFLLVKPYMALLASERSGAVAASLHCPVDVEVLSHSGDVVARFENHQNTYYSDDCDAIFAEAYDEEFGFLLPGDTKGSLRITGTDEGVMRLNLMNISAELECSEVQSYIDIPVHKGEVFTFALFDQPGGGEGGGEGGEEEPQSPVWEIVSSSGIRYESGNNHLLRVYLPASTTALEDEALLGSTSLRGILICPDGMTTLGSAALSGSGLTGVYLPPSVTDISPTAMDGSHALIYCHADSAAQTYAQENNIPHITVTQAP